MHYKVMTVDNMHLNIITVSHSVFCIVEKEIMKHLSKLRHQVLKFKKLLKDIKSTTKCKTELMCC